MRYEQFREKLDRFPLISKQYLKLIVEDDQILKNQLTRWKNNGKIIQLKRNLYVFNQNDRKINPSRLFMASEIYKPSYVSMEYALSFYGLIPEKTSDITSVASKKTSTFENVFGKFIYQHVKIDCFTGFVEAKDENGLVYFIATPEKAFIDFLYLNQNRFNDNHKDVLTESFRFQKFNTLNKKKLDYYAGLFKNKKIDRILKEVF